MIDARPRDFEDAQQPGTSQDADADRLYQFIFEQYHFSPAAYNHNEVEAVEHRAKISLKSDRVHFDEHLEREQSDEEQVGNFCK